MYSAAVLGTYLLSGGEPGLSLDAAVGADTARNSSAPSDGGVPAVTAWDLGGDM